MNFSLKSPWAIILYALQYSKAYVYCWVVFKLNDAFGILKRKYIPYRYCPDFVLDWDDGADGGRIDKANGLLDEFDLCKEEKSAELSPECQRALARVFLERFDAKFKSLVKF